MEKSDAIGIITARKGSKGVKNKNIKLLAGKPLVWYTIQHAKKSKLLKKTFCSTDSEEVEKIAKNEGIGVLNRPKRLGKDNTPIEEVLRYSISQLYNRQRYYPDIIVLLYANVPIRAESIIDTAIEKIIKTNCDCVLTVTDVGKFHPFWMIDIVDNDKLRPYSPSSVYRRQDLPRLFIHDGAVVAVKREILMRELPKANNFSIWGKDIRVIIQKSFETIEIDTDKDLIIAESILRGG
jgi:CMP-N-acetylneuraminic acid synthetase